MLDTLLYTMCLARPALREGITGHSTLILAADGVGDAPFPCFVVSKTAAPTLATTRLKVGLGPVATCRSAGHRIRPGAHVPGCWRDEMTGPRILRSTQSRADPQHVGGFVITTGAARYQQPTCQDAAALERDAGEVLHALLEQPADAALQRRAARLEPAATAARAAAAVCGRVPAAEVAAVRSSTAVMTACRRATNQCTSMQRKDVIETTCRG